MSADIQKRINNLFLLLMFISFLKRKKQDCIYTSFKQHSGNASFICHSFSTFTDAVVGAVTVVEETDAEAGETDAVV
jgi:hypothetical protein